jgi:hypothetical protein
LALIAMRGGGKSARYARGGALSVSASGAGDNIEIAAGGRTAPASKFAGG